MWYSTKTEKSVGKKYITTSKKPDLIITFEFKRIYKPKAFSNMFSEENAKSAKRIKTPKRRLYNIGPTSGIVSRDCIKIPIGNCPDPIPVIGSIEASPGLSKYDSIDEP